MDGSRADAPRDTPGEAIRVAGSDELATAVEALRRLRAIDPWTLPADGLAAQITTLSALVNAAEAVLVRSVAAFDGQELWRNDGAGGPRSWLTFHTGDRGADNSRRVRTADLANRYPAIAGALADGSITAGHAAVLAKVAIPARRDLFRRDLHVLLDAATALDVDRFDVAAQRWASIADDEIDRPPPSLRDQLDRRRLALRDSTNGMVKIDGLLPAAAAAVVRGALDHLDSPDPLNSPEGPRSAAQRAADNLVELAGRAMANPDGSPNPDATVAVTIPADILAGDTSTDRHTSADVDGPATHCGTADGRLLPPEAIRRFGCASWITTVLFSAEHEVLAYGRRRRLFSAAQRRAITARDGGCVFPGCDKPPAWCQTHHLDPWGPPANGPTDVSNGCLLCNHHHTLVHEGGWALRHDPDGGWTCFGPNRQPRGSHGPDRRRRIPPDGPAPPRRPSTRHHHRHRSTADPPSTHGSSD